MSNEKNTSAAKKNVTARSVAADILIKVEGGQYANIALDVALSRHTLTPEDKSLVTSLVYGVLERRVTLDFIISQYSARKTTELDAQVLCALRMGLYQLIYLDRIPDFAAINESVNAVPHKSAGYVNAVLRAYLRAADKSEREKKFSPTDFVQKYPVLASDNEAAVSVAYGIPVLLTRKFMQIFGEEKAQKVMGAFLKKPPITLRVNTLKSSTEILKKSLSEQGFSILDGDYLPTALQLEKGNAFDTLEFKNGDFFVQDEASQICVEVLGAEPDDLVIDTCSCPGSKSFGCAIRMQNRGSVYSFDLHESKLSLIEKSAERIGINIIKTEARDARFPDESLIGKADRVLCDVPCSGLGVIAKKPEIRAKDLSEASRLPEIQRAILEKSAQYLRSGGVLVYSTCTILPEENELVVLDFLNSHNDFCAVDFEISSRCDALPPIHSNNGYATLTPDQNNTDGFFIAKMKKL